MPTGRARLREELIAAARADDDVVGAALVGSVAAGREDDWSDIDLVLQVARDVDPATVAARWTERLYERGAVDHLDVIRSEEHTSELQSRGHLVCRLLLEKKKKDDKNTTV